MAGLRDAFDANVATGNVPRFVDEAAAAGMTNLGRGFKTGRLVNDANALAAEEVGLRAAGDVAGADALRAQISAIQQRQQTFAPDVQRVEDVNSVGSGLRWGAGQVGQGVASMLDPVAASAAINAAGRVASAIPHPVAQLAGRGAQAAGFIAPYLMNQRQLTGEFVNEANQDPELMARTSPTQLRDSANVYGAGAAVLDTAIPGIVGRQLGGFGLNKGVRGMGPGARTALGMAGEGGTEALQAAGSQALRGALNPERNTAGDSSELLNNFAGGAVGGGPLIAAGAYADAGYRRVGDTSQRLGKKAGEMIDLASESGVADTGRKIWGAAKKKAGEVIDLAKDDDGEASIGALLDKVKAGATDLKSRAQTTMDEHKILKGELPEEFLGTDEATTAKAYAWLQENDAKRDQLIVDKLTKMEDDPEAQKHLDALQATENTEGDPTPVFDAAAKFLIDDNEFSQLEQRSMAAAKTAGKWAGKVGKMAGKAGMVAGKGALKLGKGVYEGIKEGAKTSKKNMQQNELDLDSLGNQPQSDYEHWLFRTSRKGRTLADEAVTSLDATNAKQARDGGSKKFKEDAAAKERSYRRAELMGEIMALSTKRAVPANRAAAETLPFFMQDMGYEIADIAESWGMTGDGAKPSKDAGKRQAPGLKLALDNIANSLRVAFKDKTEDVLAQLQGVADPKSAPFFDYLREVVAAGGTEQGRQNTKKLRDEAASQMLLLLPVDEAKSILRAPDGPADLLKHVESFSNGHGDPDLRAALEKRLGKDTVQEMIGMVNAVTREPLQVGKTVDDRKTIEGQNGEPDVNDDTEEPSDFAKAQEEKKVAKGTGPKVYAFHATRDLRTHSAGADPFGTTENLTKKDKAERKKLGMVAVRRPALFKKGQKLFSHKDADGNNVYEGLALDKKIADVKAQLKTQKEKWLDGSETGEEMGDFNVGVKSAHEVMTDMNMQPGKTLELYRDYLYMEADDETMAPGRRKAMLARANLAHWEIVKGVHEGKVAQAAYTNSQLKPGEKEIDPGELVKMPIEVRAARDARMEDWLNDEPDGTLADFDKYLLDELHGQAAAFFKRRYLVVGEQVTNSDPSKITLTEMLDMHREGQGLLERSKGSKNKDGKFIPYDVETHNEKVNDANLLMFTSDAAPKKKVNGEEVNGEVAIPAGKLVLWVRQQRGKSQGIDVEADNYNSPGAQNRAYIQDVGEGIASLIGSDHVEGMPYKLNQFGKKEWFSSGKVAPSLRLATSTAGGVEFGKSKRVPKKVEEVDPDEYQEKVARDQNRNAEFFTAEDRAERDLVVDETTAQHMQEEKRPLVQRGAARQGASAKHDTQPDPRNAKMKHQVDRSGQMTAAPKTNEPNKTPLDFFPKAKGGVDDEFTQQHKRTKLQGESAYNGPTGESKLTAVSSARFRAEKLMEAFKKDPEAAIVQMQQRVRAAKLPSYSEDKSAAVGGVHYIAPLAYLVQRDRVAAMDLSETDQEMMDHVRKQVAQVLVEARISNGTRLKLARLMSTDPAKVTAMNVTKMLEKVAALSADKAALPALKSAPAPAKLPLSPTPVAKSTEGAPTLSSAGKKGLQLVVEADRKNKEGRSVPFANLTVSNRALNGSHSQTRVVGLLQVNSSFESKTTGADFTEILNFLVGPENWEIHSFYSGDQDITTYVVKKRPLGTLDRWDALVRTNSAPAPEVAKAGLPKGQPTQSGSRKLNAQGGGLDIGLRRLLAGAAAALDTNKRAKEILNSLSPQDLNTLQNDITSMPTAAERNILPPRLKAQFMEWARDGYGQESESMLAPERAVETQTQFLEELLDSPDDYDAVDVVMAGAILGRRSNGRKLNAQARAGKYESWKDKVASQAEIDEAIAYVKKVLGPKIKTVFKDITTHSGEYIEATNVIEISTTAAAGTMQTAYHEALHAFFAQYVRGNPELKALFNRLVNDPRHLAKLNALLTGFPAAQAQLVDGEERLAYTYQFWAAGLLQVDAKAATWLQKVGKFFRHVLGMVRDSERALELFQAFHSGKMAEPSAAGRVIAKALNRGNLTLKMRRKLDGLIQGVAALTVPAGEIMAHSVSEKARKLGVTFFTNPGDDKVGGDKEGYLNARRHVATKFTNTFKQAVENLAERDLNYVQEYLQKETELTAIPLAEHRAAVKSIRDLLERFHQHMVDAGLKIGKVEKYYPTVWSVDALFDKRAAFLTMLTTKYSDQLALLSGTKDEAAERIWQSLIDNNGVDTKLQAQRDDAVLAPFFASQEGRTLSWLKGADKEAFLQKDIVGTMMRYFHQGARAAEYTRRFGDGGVKLDATLYGTITQRANPKKNLAEIRAEDGIVHELRDAAKTKEFKTAAERDKWTARQMRDVVRSVSAMEGTLGKDISPNMRKFASWMTVYQNIRLLPLSLFSSFVDPLGLVARGATMSEAYQAFLDGMREVFRAWGDAFRDMPAERKKTEWQKLAEHVGAVDSALFSHFVAEQYGSEYMTPGAKKVNDKMFIFNGMEAWNRGMRVAATKSAVKFIERHSWLPDKTHSRRWLMELGLTPANITLNADGELITDRHELATAKGISLDLATKEMAAIHYAITRWVEGAVLTPNAAQRPAWSSDPHWAMMFHLKQFSYSFHQVILKRAVGELKHGNLAPMGAFVWYVPTMMAADITKGLIQGAGELPAYMQGWSLGDHVANGVKRAGLAGVGNIGMDVNADLASLGGPAVEQIIDSLQDPIGRTTVNALPLHALYGEALK